MKNKLIIIIIIALLVIAVILYLTIGHPQKNEQSDLDISYDKGELIEYKDFSKGFVDERTITVKNTTDKNTTFSLEWIKVKNSLKKQNKFKYEISCVGERCAELGKSQIPVASATIYPQVVVEANKTQIYKVKITYTGSEKKSTFTGKLIVVPESQEIQSMK